MVILVIIAGGVAAWTIIGDETAVEVAEPSGGRGRDPEEVATTEAPPNEAQGAALPVGDPGPEAEQVPETEDEIQVTKGDDVQPLEEAGSEQEPEKSEEPEEANSYDPLPEPATECATAPECNTRGFRYYQAKDYERALPYFSAALQRNPAHVKAIYNAACMFALLEDTDSAITMLRRLAVMDDPDAKRRIRKVARDGDFDPIRHEPKFQQAMRELRR